MGHLIENLEVMIEHIVNLSSICIEVLGILILITYAVSSFIQLIKKEECTHKLARGIALSLEFLMCGEVLKTVTAQDLSELFILGAIVILRAAMTFLLHWEMKNEKE